MSSLVCYCQDFCPPNEGVNGTCEVDENSYCFASIALEYHEETGKFIEYSRWGCLGRDETGLMQVNRLYFIFALILT